MTAAEKFLQARDFLLRHRSEYDVAYRNFHLPKLDEFNWALDFFDQQAKDNETTALWVIEEDGSETKISFSEMSARSSRVANFFRAHGIGRGDRILVMLGNQIEFWETVLASIKLGAVLIPSAPLLTKADLADRIERGRVKLVITNSSEVEKFSELKADFIRVSIGEKTGGWLAYDDAYREDNVFSAEDTTMANDSMLLYFTSGTTSKPKMVLHSQTSYPAGHLSTMYWIGLCPGDVHLNISSPGWAKHAWSSLFAPWNAGATTFVYNYSRFDAEKMLTALSRHRITSLCAPPTVWRMLVQENLTNYQTTLREIVSAGEPLNAEIIERVRRAWGLTIRDGYGQTETTAQIGNPPGQEVKPGSMGKPLPGYKVALLGADGESDQEGEISLDLSANPIGLMLAYEDDSENTSNAMRDGFYHTGDLAARDEDGYLIFIGRNDDIFKSSDYRISPFELESVLLEHEAVAEAAVVPSPDAVRRSVPKAFVSLAPGHSVNSATALSILEHCRIRLAPYKRIRRIEFGDLPKTVSGKIRRAELRAAEEKRDLNSQMTLEFWEENFSELSSNH